ncbi:MAG: C10 family peptidase [Planctomycetota bacterium]|jgi:hypothetical protein
MGTIVQPQRRTGCTKAVLVLLILLGASFRCLRAEPVGVDKATDAVAGWLRINPQPLGAPLGRKIERIETFADDTDSPVYFVVSLEPDGYVIVPADDAVEPILCFVEAGLYDASDDTPLSGLVSRDVPARITAIRALKTAKDQTEGDNLLEETAKQAREKWTRLAEAASPATKSKTTISDIRVEPLVQSAWGQTTIGSYTGGISCYNYYTPPHENGNSYNYPIGCVAAAMSQLMRYHEHPGTYSWSLMPLDPDASAAPAQRQAIGWLCFQAAESINTHYAAGGSTASVSSTDGGLVNSFGYGSAAIATEPSMGLQFNTMVNPNLDAGLPVLLGVQRSNVGHAVVCDGYGYDFGTLYHHLNMGWTGTDNVWYALPIIDATLPYYTIKTCVYNIYTSGSGEIISGRACDLTGNGIPDVQITATPSGESPRYASTDSRGVFAFANMPSNKYVTLTASKPPHSFADKSATTGISRDWLDTGNVWGVNFISTTTTPPTAYGQTASATSGVVTPISLSAGDDGYPDPPGRITYKISGTPLHGMLSDPAGGEITVLPYTLANNGNIVNYRACSYYSGPDEFNFKAYDGGTAPEGGDSDPAIVSIDVDNVSYTTYAPQTNTASAWPLYTSYEDSRTQVLYLSADIGGPKRITALALDVYEKPGNQLNNWTIRMKHTTRSNFAYQPYFETDGWTTVYYSNEGTLAVGWYEFEFQTPFEYDGTSNLIIDFSHDNDSWDMEGYCIATETYEDRVTFGFSDSMHGSPLYWDDNTFLPSHYPYYATMVPNIRLKSEAGGEAIIGDFVRNCSVDIVDLVQFCNSWLSTPGDPDWCPQCDISDPANHVIDEVDFARFAEHWRQTTE